MLEQLGEHERAAGWFAEIGAFEGSITEVSTGQVRANKTRALQLGVDQIIVPLFARDSEKLRKRAEALAAEMSN